MKRQWLWSVFLILALLAGCGGGGSKGSDTSPTPNTGAANLSSIEISSSSEAVQVDMALALSATAHYADQRKEDVSKEAAWSSSANDVATVDAQGNVRGLKAGRVEISATYEGLVAKKQLTVEAVQLTSLKIDPLSPLAAGESADLILAGQFSNNSNRKDLASQAEWIVSNPAVASVADGRVTGKAAGQTTLRARIGTVTSDPVTLTVNSAVLQSLSIIPVVELPSGVEQGTSLIELPRGVAGTLMVTGYYSNGQTRDLSSDGDLTLTSSNGAVAQFDPAHRNRLTGLSVGTAEITASYGTKTATANVRVFADIEVARALTVSPAPATLSGVGKTLQMKATGIYAYLGTDGQQKKVYWDVTPVAQWTSNNTTFVTVDNSDVASGLVTAKAYGQATVSASYRDVTGTSLVTVSGATLQRIEVTYPESLTHPNLVVPFKAVGVWSDTSSRDISAEVNWSSDNPAVATVDSTGKVTLLPPGGGTAIISASYPGVPTASAPPIVSTTATPQELWAQPENALHPVNFDFPYTVKCRFSDQTIGEVTTLATWTSSNPAVAIINADGKKGVTRTLAEGTTNIQASWLTLTDVTPMRVQQVLPLELFWRRTSGDRQYPLPEICDGDWCKEYTSASAGQNIVYRTYVLRVSPQANPVTLTGVQAVDLTNRTTASFGGLTEGMTLQPGSEVAFTLRAVAPAAGQRARVEWSFDAQGLGEQFRVTVYLDGR